METRASYVTADAPNSAQANPLMTTSGEMQNHGAASQWYAVQTRPRHEKKVSAELRLRSVDEFLPVHRCKHRWRNGIIADLELPLFPGYLFARVSPNDRVRLLNLPGIVGLAVSSAHPTMIPEEDIQAIRTLINIYGVEPHPFLNVGDRVRIIAGPLTGMEGILVRKKQELRVVLSLDIIMRAIAVEVSEFDIEPIPGRSHNR